MQVCTAVTESHLPWARALASSFAEQHPGAAPVAVLVVDDRNERVDGAAEPFRLLRPGDVGIDGTELHRRAAMYRPMELAGSTRGALLATLLAASGGEPVLFLDADVVVLGSLEPLAEQTRAAGIVLSPHLPGPPPQPIALERELLRAGAFNAGYVAVAGHAGARFAAWWAAHLARHCVDDPGDGLFVSQRWLDLAPSLFAVALLRDPGSNVTQWNLGARTVAHGAGGWTIDGEPLRFLHVGGGFDPRASAWPQLSPEPGVTGACRAYAARLLEAGYRWPPAPSYGFAQTADGVALEPWVRRRCRAALLAGEAFPDPFDAATAPAFAAWLAAPADAVVAPAPAVSRWALALRDWRADLRAVFPDVPGADAARFLRWLAEQSQHAVPAPFRPPPVTLPEEEDGRAHAEAHAHAAQAYAALREHADAEQRRAAAEIADVREELAAERGALATVRAERDAALRALQPLRASRVVRATALPRRAWYRLRRARR